MDMSAVYGGSTLLYCSLYSDAYIVRIVQSSQHSACNYFLDTEVLDHVTTLRSTAMNKYQRCCVALRLYRNVEALYYLLNAKVLEY